MDIVSFNGEFVSLENASLSVTDAGFLYGHGVFSTVRVEQAQLLHGLEHVRRLMSGARILNIPMRSTIEEILSQAEQVIDSNGFETARLRMTLTKGPLKNYPIQNREGEETLVMTAVKWSDPPMTEWVQGWKTVWSPFPLNHLSPLARVKSTCYTENIIARDFAQQRGAQEAIFYNIDDELAEGAMSNVFLVRGNSILTPAVECGALPGILRGILLKLAEEEGFDVVQGSLDPSELETADEVFLTNSIRMMIPVVEHEGVSIGNGEVGPVTKRLFQRYRTYVESILSQRRA